MEKLEIPGTTAVRFLREKNIEFIPRFYTYEAHGGTRVASSALNVQEHNVIKTLVFETDAKQPMLVLMHGDWEVSVKQLARTLGVKQVVPSTEENAYRHTGYQVGGISPFGTRKQLPVYIESTIMSLERIYINGGKRGFLLDVLPAALRVLPQITEVTVGIVPE
jgi:Cys-tRNA(Pro) deacylase